MRPAVRLLGALLLGLAVYFYGATSEVSWLFLLAFLIWGLSLAAYSYARWNAHGLTAVIAVAGARPGPDSPVELLPESVLRAGPLPAPLFEGDAIDLELALVSARGTRGPARLRGRIAGVELAAATGVVSAAGWRVNRSLDRARRGVLLAEDWTLETSDPLGLFRHRSRRPSAEVALVLPRFGSLEPKPRYRELEASAAAPRAGAGNELFGVREYRPGDALRRIHWRTSARRGQLVVREYEPPGMQVLVVACDPRPPSREAADQVARIAASEAWDCLRSGGQVLLWAPGFESSLRSESRSIWALLEWLARYPDLVAADDRPAAGGQRIAIACSAASAVLDDLSELRHRGGEVRAWLVGDFAAEIDIPSRRAGLSWPL